MVKQNIRAVGSWKEEILHIIMNRKKEGTGHKLQLLKAQSQ
jgi:hypothetical protein